MEDLPVMWPGGGPVEVPRPGWSPGLMQKAPCGWGGGDEQVEFLEEIHPQDWVSHLCQQKPMRKPGLTEFDLQCFETPGTNRGTTCRPKFWAKRAGLRVVRHNAQ